MRTYIIENSQNQVQAIYKRLSDAKYDLVKMYRPNRAVIICLSGPNYAEGYHMYKIIFNGTKFKKLEK